ncbi:conserved hypothetical protein [Paenibacillus curdlanolyticus YK9]|uniref:Spore coat protein B n=1 Tax=Paenibacillus curdlanolyticus YK9 TaxID=717606 RepID=E0I6G1_9BACL|nr:DUF2642 domain-containing protein [Paenibacillus curdlanolyticus]EFM11627.1 conserved hypothetical protein [Paenibacillus curdlanolyticus YK9]
MMYGNMYNNYCRKPHRSSSSGHKSAPKPTQENFLNALIGKKVKINRGGPNSIVGRLLAVKSDYLVVATWEGIVYVKTAHIKSITELDGSSGSRSGGHSSGRSDGRTEGRTGGRSRGGKKFIDADNFTGVLKALNQHFVQVNWGGPEKVVGFLSEVKGDHILVVSDHKIIKIFILHIQSIKLENMRSRGSSGRSGGSAGAQGVQGQKANPTTKAAAPALKKRTTLKRRISR